MAQKLFLLRVNLIGIFKTALRGALYGGLASIFLFSAFCLWTNYNLGRAEASQVTALFGHISISSIPYGKIILLIIFVSFLTTLTNRMTILAQLKKSINVKTVYFNFMTHHSCHSNSLTQNNLERPLLKRPHYSWSVSFLFRYFPPTTLTLAIIVFIFWGGFIVFSEKLKDFLPQSLSPKLMPSLC